MGTLKLCDDTQVLHLGVVVYVRSVAVFLFLAKLKN